MGRPPTWRAVGGLSLGGRGGPRKAEAGKPFVTALCLSKLDVYLNVCRYLDTNMYLLYIQKLCHTRGAKWVFEVVAIVISLYTSLS